MGKLTRALLLLVAAAVAAQGQWFGGGGGKKYDRVSWGLCIGTPCAIGNNLTVPFISILKGKIDKCFVAAKFVPTGAALIFDVKVDGTSIFNASKFELPDGAATASITTIVNPATQEGSQITVDITQTGSTFAGRDVSLVCRIGL